MHDSNTIVYICYLIATSFNIPHQLLSLFIPSSNSSVDSICVRDFVGSAVVNISSPGRSLMKLLYSKGHVAGSLVVYSLCSSIWLSTSSISRLGLAANDIRACLKSRQAIGPCVILSMWFTVGNCEIDACTRRSLNCLNRSTRLLYSLNPSWRPADKHTGLPVGAWLHCQVRVSTVIPLDRQIVPCASFERHLPRDWIRLTAEGQFLSEWRNEVDADVTDAMVTEDTMNMTCTCYAWSSLLPMLSLLVKRNENVVFCLTDSWPHVSQYDVSTIARDHDLFSCRCNRRQNAIQYAYNYRPIPGSGLYCQTPWNGFKRICQHMS